MMPRRDHLSTASRAVTSLVTVVLGCWTVAAAALDRDGAIEAAKREVKDKCAPETPCKFTATAERGQWQVRVEFTKRRSPEEKPLPYPGGHAIFIINQTGKVVGRIAGK
jgi:hypothetical protein